MVDEVLDDETRLREDQGLGVGGAGRDADEGRFAQRVDLFELGRREHVLPLVGFEAVADWELFEEPEDALGAGFFEPGGFVSEMLGVGWEGVMEEDG